jgi:hypothetical protein
MLWILAADNIHISAALPPHTLTSIAQFLDRATHFHASCLLSVLQSQAVEARCEVLEELWWLAGCAETWSEKSAASACWCVDVAGTECKARGGEDSAPQGEEERTWEHFDGLGSRCGVRCRRSGAMVLVKFNRNCMPRNARALLVLCRNRPTLKGISQAVIDKYFKIF